MGPASGQLPSQSCAAPGPCIGSSGGRAGPLMGKDAEPAGVASATVLARVGVGLMVSGPSWSRQDGVDRTPQPLPTAASRRAPSLGPCGRVCPG